MFKDVKDGKLLSTLHKRFQVLNEREKDLFYDSKCSKLTSIRLSTVTSPALGVIVLKSMLIPAIFMAQTLTRFVQPDNTRRRSATAIDQSHGNL